MRRINNKLDRKNLTLSIVIPTYNEQKNVGILYRRLKSVLDKLALRYEIVFVDDGSRDGTFRELRSLHNLDKRVRVIRFRKNFGQTAAMDAGFKQARGDIIISLDADLQNDPNDIPRLLEKIMQGYDVVCCWRKNRKDTLSKHITSRFANIMRKFVINDKIHDSGCTLKAYKKECFEDLNLFGEMHRFIPALLRWKGFKITEIPVAHHSRKYGKTKYNAKRLMKGFLDMIVVKFWMQYSTRPVHLFGGIGILMSTLGFLTGIYLSIMKIVFGQSLSDRPLLLLAILLIILGIQFMIFGLIVDIQIKDFYQNRRPYNIERIL